MGKLQNNQNGFSAIEGLLILVVMAIIGFTGWYVWHAKNNTDKNLASNNSSTLNLNKKSTIKSTSPVFATLQSNWTEYKNSEKGLRLGYPKEWGTLSGTPASTADYRDDGKNMQGRMVIEISPKEGFSIVARKYGATITPSPDGKSWKVSEENPSAVDGYKVGDAYKAKEIPVNGAKMIDISFDDEECTLSRWIIPLKESYAAVTIPELCPVASNAALQAIPLENKTAYNKLISDFIKTITVY